MDIKNIEHIIHSAYTPEEYPVCRYLTDKWSQSRPLEGLSVLDATPVFRNTLVKHLSLIAAGADLIVGISDVMPYDNTIVDILRSSGIRVARPEDMIDTDIILDCAASFNTWNPHMGFAELTRSGVEKFDTACKPVFVADSGVIKKIETCLGTGDSYFRAMKHLGYDDCNGRRLVVFGSGKVGTGIITYAVKAGAEVVVVTDPSSVSDIVKRSVSKVVNFNDRIAVSEAVKDAYAVVTATGIHGAVEKCCCIDAINNSNALLANMGVEDEYGASISSERVMNKKKTLNFILDEHTHLKYMDATMALHSAGAIYLKDHPLAIGAITPPTELETELLYVCRREGCITDELELITKGFI